MTIQQSVETVSPATSQRWLAGQGRNRKPVDAHVAYLAAVMGRGEWGVAQPIIFDTEGNLIDGQHRLLAVIQHAKPVRFAVMRGVDPALWGALDTGRSRKGRDVLSARKRPSADLLAATLRLVWQDELRVLGSTAPEARPTNTDVLDRDAEHPEIGNEVIPAVAVNRYARNAPTAFLYWRTHRANPQVAEAFWPGVLTGEQLRRDTAPFLLHRLLIDQRAGARARRLNGLELLAYEIKAWNYALLDPEDAPAHLRWARGVEDFPPICSTRAQAEQAVKSSRDQRRARRSASAA